jgi:hypothetical protein
MSKVYDPPVCIPKVSWDSLLSLHVWRKTLRGGMPVTLPTTTNSTTAEKPIESQNRDLDCSAFSVLHIFGNKLLRG